MAPPGRSRPPNHFVLGSYACAAVFAMAFGLDLFRMPIQVSDSLAEIVAAQSTSSVGEAFVQNLRQEAYLRPLRIAQIKAIFDASGGRYHLAYRGFHVALFTLTLTLFVRALQVKTATDLSAAMFAMTVFLGLHTFAGAVGSAYPINHFLEMIFFSLLAVNILQGPPSWLRDVSALVAFGAAALTLESGLLVWVVLVVGHLAGLRGVSRRGVVAATVLLAAYVFIRFIYFGTGTPALTERSSGFGFEILEPDELQARFGANPLSFYGYNVISSILSVIAAEPRAGVWVFTRYWIGGDVPPWATVAVVTSLVTTLVIAVAGLLMLRAGERERDASFIVLFCGVLVANAVLSYAYTKDEIVGVAGAFYALAAFASVRFLIDRSPRINDWRAIPLVVLLAVSAGGWAIRTAGLHHVLLYQGFKQRGDWITVPSFKTERARALVGELRRDALNRPLPAPRFIPRWTDRWFEE